MDRFTQGYVDAMFASAQEALREPVSFGIGYTYPPFGPSDLSAETRARIIADCERYRGRTSSRARGVGALFWKNRAAGYLSGDGWEPLTLVVGDGRQVVFA